MNGSNLPAPLFSRLTALADPIRTRLLLLLERHELTVTELCAVLQLPQSTVSRHLKVLGDAGWAASRADGTSRRYRMAGEAEARALWETVRADVSALPAALEDAARLPAVLAARETRSQRFFSSAASRWDRVRAETFGARPEFIALLGLLDPRWEVGDLGCGTGQVSAALAPFVRRVVAVDNSAPMLAAARERVGALANVDLREGALEALPVADASLDAVLLVLVLAYVEGPAAVIAEAARVLRPGGRLLIVDVGPHEREELRLALGQLWRGFAPEGVARWLAACGLRAGHYVPLPPDAAVKGPPLFAAAAVKPGTTRTRSRRKARMGAGASPSSTSKSKEQS